MNESVAPSEYSVPTNWTSPGRRIAIGAIPANRTSERYGVLNRGWSLRKTSGICRYVAIEYVIREAPMIPAFVAMKRIVAARIPT